MLVRAKAVEFFETSTIVPVKEVTQMLEGHKRARKCKVATAPNGQNPNTTNGVSVSQFVIDEARVRMQNSLCWLCRSGWIARRVLKAKG